MYLPEAHHDHVDADLVGMHLPNPCLDALCPRGGGMYEARQMYRSRFFLLSDGRGYTNQLMTRTGEVAEPSPVIPLVSRQTSGHGVGEGRSLSCREYAWKPPRGCKGSNPNPHRAVKLYADPESEQLGALMPYTTTCIDAIYKWRSNSGSEHISYSSIYRQL